VKYTGVYPGIDLVYHGNQRLLEYDFRIAPGADPAVIDLRFQGAKKLSVNKDGALVIGIGSDEVIEPAPVVYQEIGGRRQAVAGRYLLRSEHRVGFDVAEYDHNQVLVIDPTLVYSTYLGGTAQTFGRNIAVDSAGNAYISGDAGPGFPVTAGSYQTTGSGILVAKVNAAGSALLYATYISGEGFTTGIAVDASGNAYLAGQVQSNTLATTPGAFQTAFHGGSGDGFVTKLNSDGSRLIYSTYLGGSNFDVGTGIAVDSLGCAYVTGYTWSSDFPTTLGAFQAKPVGERNVFISKLNSTGSALVYSTYLGGSGTNGWYGGAITVDTWGNAYVTGMTNSASFPTTADAFKYGAGNAYPGHVFVTKLNFTGSGLVYSSYLGGTHADSGTAIAVDAAGNAYVTGTTASGDFPITTGALQMTIGSGYYSAFVCKFNTAGSALEYSTYLGGRCRDTPTGIAVDSEGNAHITGATCSADFPITPNAIQTNLGNGGAAFVTKLNASGSALLYSTFFGDFGAWGSVGSDTGLDASGNVYITGQVYAPGSIRTTPGALQGTIGAANQAFVSKLSLGGFTGSGAVTTATLSGPRGDYGWYFGAVTATLSATGPVAATYYSLDGQAYAVYIAPIPISAIGVHQLLYYSVDTSNHQETPRQQTIKIDTPPVSHITSLASPASSPNFNVQWFGTDAMSGIRDYTIYVSDNGSAFTPISQLTNTTSTSSWFAGYLGHTYRFYSSARDQAGNVEVKTIADTSTTVPAQMPEDVNGDGQINCADLAIVKAHMGAKTGQPNYLPAADVNHDGVIDVRDLANVSQKMIPGTKCP
jgi:hypothetical protein